MYCSSCGKKIADTSKFCPFCGCQLVISGDGNEGAYNDTSEIKKERMRKANKGQAFQGFRKPGDINENSMENPQERPSKNECKEKLTSVQGTARSLYRKRAIVAAIAAIIVFVFLVTFIGRRMVDEPCDWCNRRPTMAFKTSDGSMSYVCSECRKNCKWCDKKATKHYENMLGMIVFVCDDCYKEASSD